MTDPPPENVAVRNPHKRNRGLRRAWVAAQHSMSGLRFAVREESSFRQELLASVCLLPIVFILRFSTVERLLLIGSLFLVLIVELLNSSLEAAVDRISFEYHALAKRAKDYGSAAVMLSLLLCLAVWVTLLWKSLRNGL